MSHTQLESKSLPLEPVRTWQWILGGIGCLTYCLAPWLQTYGVTVGLWPWLTALIVLVPSVKAIVRHARRASWRLLLTVVIVAALMELSNNVVSPLLRRIVMPGLEDPNPADVIAMFHGNIPLLLFMTVVIGPLIEEVLYRFSLFNPLSTIAPALGYMIVGGLFGFQHVLPSLVETADPYYLINMVGYVLSGLALCWGYRRESTLLAPLLAHMLSNATVIFML